MIDLPKSEKVSISLPGELLSWMDSHLSGRGRSAYVQDLIRQDMESKTAQAELHALVDEAAAAGMDVRAVLESELRKGAA